MVSRTATRIVRAIRLVPVLSCMFAGCTCSSGPPVSPTPTVTPEPRATQTRSSVPHPTVTPVPPPPAAPAAATSTLPPKPNATATASAASSVCEGYVAVLSGKKQDKALLDNPAVQALAQQAPDLVKCGAVRLDSEALCMLLGSDAEKGRTKECLSMRAIFHELRTYPKGRSFYMLDSDWRDCHAGPFAPICDALREAMRSGDASKCVLTADFRSICRSVMADLKESQCRKMGPEIKRVMEARCRAHATVNASACHLEAAKGDLFEQRVRFLTEAEDECRRAVEERASMGKGLSALAESGSPDERELAKAALSQADACTLYARPVMDACLTNSGRPVALAPPPRVEGSPMPTPPTPGGG